MRKLIKVLMVSCLCTSFAGGVTAYAALDLETEASAAGISVVLNNYYAGSLNPVSYTHLEGDVLPPGEGAEREYHRRVRGESAGGRRDL